MSLYRHKPNLVSAIQWKGDNELEVEHFCAGRMQMTPRAEATSQGQLHLHTLSRHGILRLQPDDWLVINAYGTVQVWQPEMFEHEFEAAATP